MTLPYLFQFPSNGKARVNLLLQHTCGSGTVKSVSIPFKRESTCEQRTSTLVLTLVTVVSIPFKRESTCELCLIGVFTQCRGFGVSIPFKRESTCERGIRHMD